MNYRNFFIILFAALVAVGIFYYREYLPPTKADIENLYYFIANSVIPTEPRACREGSGGIPLGENGSNQNKIMVPNNSSLEGSLDFARDDSKNANDASNGATKEAGVETLPDSINNSIPFTPQAPFGKWDQLHEEACEEASLAIAHYFLDDRKIVLSKEAEKDIQDLTKFINKDDVNVEELKKIAENYYKHSGWKIIGNPSVEDFKKELAAGNVIIVPLAGREIGNPYYKQPGPLYHMLVVSGYDNKRGLFITQDPGTKRGKNYEYKFQILINAIHDWTGDKNKIKEGPAKILVVAR